MRRWGVLITTFYAFVLIVLLAPASASVVSKNSFTLAAILELYKQWQFWIFIAILIAGEALLLFVSVDTSFRRLKPRVHIAVSVVTAAMLFAVLLSAAIWTLGAASRGDKFTLPIFGDNPWLLCGLLWAAWGVVFGLYFRNVNASLTRLVGWLLKGSVLEFLIAVPCHVIVRRREECCAPVLTAFGMATGLALMFLAFGPSVLLLFKKRLDKYSTRAKVVGAV